MPSAQLHPTPCGGSRTYAAITRCSTSFTADKCEESRFFQLFPVRQRCTALCRTPDSALKPGHRGPDQHSRACKSYTCKGSRVPYCTAEALNWGNLHPALLLLPNYSPCGFVKLKQKMFGTWALLQQQYGNLQCLSSVGLLFRVYMTCAPPTASYGCDVWGHHKLTAATAASCETLAKSHVHIVRQISGVRSKTAVTIPLAEFGLMCLPDQWLLCAATFWNALAALPPTSIYKRMAWNAKGVSSAIRRTGNHLPISQGDMVQIDVQALSSHLRQRRDAVWENLDICSRICRIRDSRMCTQKLVC